MDPVIHDAGEFSLMGCMTSLPNYQSGDWVRYGGMIYKPEGFGKLAYTVGDYASGGGDCCPGYSGCTKHYMNTWTGPDGTVYILCS